VKLCDANLLLYAVDESSSHHEPAIRWLEARLSGTETMGFAWVSLLTFLRLSTRPQVFTEPLTASSALDLVDEWLAQPCSVVLDPTARHGSILRTLLDAVGTAGNLTTDAHLAAIAIEHGAELCSADADFSRFPGLRWVNPLTLSSSG
jgi:toxin-antitoxin system PIN domain toxin